MEASARMTCRFLNLKEGDTALLCMPLQYISGKMVVVRSLVCGLRLVEVEPCGHPLRGLKEAPVFAAMVPMQVYNSMAVEEECALLRQIKHLIIGGGAVNAEMAAVLKTFPNAVWSTYGMTETLSHIALRRLSGPDASSRECQHHERRVSHYKCSRRVCLDARNQRHCRDSSRRATLPHKRPKRQRGV